MLSTYPTDAGYESLSGTSMAAPQIAGPVGLVRSLDPSLNANQVENEINQAADGENGRSGPNFGAGRIDVFGTVERVG